MPALKIESQVNVCGLGKSVDAGAIKWRWTYFSFHINQPNIFKMQKQKRNWKKKRQKFYNRIQTKLISSEAIPIGCCSEWMIVFLT